MAGIFNYLFKREQKSKVIGNDALRILLYADVDMNLIDGSSIWLNSLTQVLALEEKFHVTVLLKARKKTNRLTDDLEHFMNVSVINTFEHFHDFSFENNNRLTIRDAVDLIQLMDISQPFHCILLRGFELCQKAISCLKRPEIIIPYFTTFSSPKDSSKVENIKLLEQILQQVTVVFIQTPEMKTRLIYLTGCPDDKIVVLNPMIPNFPDEKPTFINRHNKLVYTGKFSNEYNVIETLQTFQELNNTDYVFHLAGDKFHADLRIPEVEFVEWMKRIPNVYWHKGINREEVSALIQSSDLGLCWRSSAIDNINSMELSTKVLEYGRLGKPVLLRRIPIHERLLGKEYPFFVETASELSNKIKIAFGDPSLYAYAAHLAFDASQEFTFNKTISRVSSNIWKFKKN